MARLFCSWPGGRPAASRILCRNDAVQDLLLIDGVRASADKSLLGHPLGRSLMRAVVMASADPAQRPSRLHVFLPFL
jgi:hypothetical protein